MPGWNFAEVWEVVAEALPDAPAQVQGDRRFTWREFDRRADGIAQALLEAGAEQQDKVAQYLYNCPEYLESMYAAFKAGLVPVNTNYRYADDELVYLWDNADAVAVVFHGTFADRIERHPRPGARACSPGCGSTTAAGPCPDVGHAVRGRRRPRTPSAVVAAVGPRRRRPPTCSTPAAPPACPRASCGARTTCSARSSAPSAPRVPRRAPTSTPCATRVHGRRARRPARPARSCTAPGCFTQLITLCRRRLASSRSTSRALRRRRAARHHRARGASTSIAIVGDAFAKPMLRALDADARPVGPLEPRSSIIVVGRDVERGDQAGPARATTPAMMLVDAFSSSEALGMGQSVSRGRRRGRHGQVHARRATPGSSPTTARDVEPGSGEIGRVAVGGLPARSATTRTRRSRPPRSSTIDGERYSMPGDYATVEADGTLTLLGRGSVCINTGGEKVFPEEVEEVAQDPRRRRATRSPSACPTRSSARRSPPWSSSRPAPTLDEAERHRPREGASWPPTRRRSGCCRSTPSAGPRTARSTTSACRAYAEVQVTTADARRYRLGCP